MTARRIVALLLLVSAAGCARGVEDRGSAARSASSAPADAEPVVEAVGTRFVLDVREGPLRVTQDGLRRWITTAAESVATIHGDLPHSPLRVIVQPVRSRGGPVVFGENLRGGRPAVRLLVASDATDAELVGEWVAVHELVHQRVIPWERWMTA